METQLFTVPEFSRVFGVSRWLVRRMIKKGQIQSVQVGHHRRIPARAAQIWLEGAQAVEPRPAKRVKKTAGRLSSAFCNAPAQRVLSN